jgi:hypothetical protein
MTRSLLSSPCTGSLPRRRFASRIRRQLTFPNLDKPYPDDIFTSVWGADRPAFNPAPEVAYRSKRICVTGLIKEYRAPGGGRDQPGADHDVVAMIVTALALVRSDASRLPVFLRT